jgi:hypothetical protein
LILVALSAPAYPADNATITGDGVRMRNQPSTSWTITEVLPAGTRVEVVSRTNFTETIDGHTAVWYEVRHGDFGGYVFGRFVELDRGLTVPIDDSRSAFSDPVYRFADHGVHRFGMFEADVLAHLGQPISRTKKAGLSEGDIDHILTYDGLVIKIYEYATGGRRVYEVSYTTDAYAVDGIKVGSPRSDVESLLGKPHEEKGDTISYWERNAYLSTSFRIRDGKVVEITCFSDYYD